MSVTTHDSLTALEHELQLRGLTFDAAVLRAFVASAWCLIAEDPDVSRWAAESAERVQLAYG